MSRHHVQLLRTIFNDPPSANLHWREIESFLRHVGAAMEPLSGARWRVTLGRESLLQLRAFLARSGVGPAVAVGHGGTRS